MPAVAALRALCGVAEINAIGLAAEICDLSRFDRPQHLADLAVGVFGRRTPPTASFVGFDLQGEAMQGSLA